MTQRRRSSDSSVRVALVTGANRGIGFEVCRQLAEQGFTVVLTARDAHKAREAAAKLKSVGHVEPAVVDVSDARSIQKAVAEISKRHDHPSIFNTITHTQCSKNEGLLPARTCKTKKETLKRVSIKSRLINSSILKRYPERRPAARPILQEM